MNYNELKVTIGKDEMFVSQITFRNKEGIETAPMRAIDCYSYKFKFMCVERIIVTYSLHNETDTIGWMDVEIEHSKGISEKNARIMFEQLLTLLESKLTINFGYCVDSKEIINAFYYRKNYGY